MSTETAKITSAKLARKQTTGEEFIDVEVTFTQGRGAGKVEEVRKYGYPIDTSTKEIEADIAKALETRQAERDQAEAQAEADAKAEETAATVAALEGTKVTQ